MPRRPRDFAPGLHHVWVNATGHWPYYVDELDRTTWVRRLVRVVDAHDWTCIAFCEMTTHVHFLVDVPDESLPVGMLYLNREYSKDFNARHERVGAFVRTRYGNRRIDGGEDLLGAYAYVVTNPVEAEMCAAAEDWRWSSFATTLGLCDDFPFVNASIVATELGSTVGFARERLRDLAAGYRRARLVPLGHDRYQVPDVSRRVR